MGNYHHEKWGKGMMVCFAGNITGDLYRIYGVTCAKMVMLCKRCQAQTQTAARRSSDYYGFSECRPAGTVLHIPAAET